LENEHWVWLVPYWAVWPYETMLLPKTHVLRLQDLTTDQRKCKSTFNSEFTVKKRNNYSFGLY